MRLTVWSKSCSCFLNLIIFRRPESQVVLNQISSIMRIVISMFVVFIVVGSTASHKNVNLKTNQIWTKIRNVGLIPFKKKQFLQIFPPVHRIQGWFWICIGEYRLFSVDISANYIKGYSDLSFSNFFRSETFLSSSKAKFRNVAPTREQNLKNYFI